jgi:phage tail sheath protein FI
MKVPGDAERQEVRALHVAMLRFCAARSDCFAVLALPRHYRQADALAHAGALGDALGGADTPGDVGARTLSFGALYHPWTIVRTTATAAPLRAIPPDGATCGVMATRANTLGAWAAPANQPLAGVAVLDPRLPESVRAAFLGNRVNAVAPFPRGFMTWSEETLSGDPELRGVGVRRLLILLRRLVLREGNTWVFEPNDGAFRRLVQRQFDGLLGDMYVRGAFAGASHAEAYRVVTDDTVNPPQNVEQGRLVVELRIAPSRPLAFLTVRLVQTGAGMTVQES